MPDMRGKSNQVRIIGGRWRGRKLPFPDVEGLRPTADRVRETVFNWLQPVIEGARCLDLFAGSGAFGFEAASRGAGRVVMVDRDPRVVAGLKALGEKLGGNGIDLRCQDALSFLDGAPESFDILFLDPPFKSGLLPPVITKVLSAGWLAPMARVYVEADDEGALHSAVDGRLRFERLKKAGNVWYGLLREAED
jgi:16S rRNA (guanine966-N2)-methyltransferase